MAAKDLESKIKALIKQDGPISIANFMQMVLLDPEFGYYIKQDPFGESGDFITAPEISQVFGEIIGAYIAYKWQEMGEPDEFQVVELGPGNGALMHDILRTLKIIPKLFASLKIHLVEISPTLRKKQLETLKSFNLPIVHHDDLTKIPKIKSYIVANEFFDALPINQYQYREGSWHEKKIKLGKDDHFIFALEPNKGKVDFIREMKKPKDDDVYEISFQAINVMVELSNFISKTGSNAMFIDYGYIEKSYGDTFQALKKHKFNHIFENLGEADLTAHVDFEELSTIAAKNDNIEVSLATQGEFFSNFGYKERTEALKRKSDRETAKLLDTVQDRILHPNQMGELFKVMLVETS